MSRLHGFLVPEALVLVGNDLAGAPCTGLCLAPTKPRVNDCDRVQARSRASVPCIASLTLRRITWPYTMTEWYQCAFEVIVRVVALTHTC